MDFPLKRNAAAATVKVRNIACLPKVLEDLGVDPAPVLRMVGVEPALFANPDNTLSYAVASRLIAHCVTATGCDDFGLRVGVRLGPPAMGLTGLVSINAPVVREGLRVILGTLQTTDTGGAAFLDIRGRAAFFGYAVTARDAEAIDQIEDLAIAIGFNIMRQLCGAGWRPASVRFARKAPADRTLFARFFGAPLQFSDGRTCLEFDSAILDAPVRTSNPDHSAVLAPLLDEAVANATPDFLSSVKAIVRAQVAAGSLSRASVCRAVGLNARTFSYRLESLGVTYSGLADEARFDAACSLLLRDKPLMDIATALGFAEQSAFTRAFKAWSGTTPARWRATLSGQPR